jgi:hypothetical protein
LLAQILSMKRSALSCTIVFLIPFIAQSQTLQTVTDNGHNTTSNLIQITGTGNIPGGAGLELFRSGTDGVLQAFDRTAGTPNKLRLQPVAGSITTINDAGTGRLLINNPTDDGTTALQVNGDIRSSAGVRVSTWDNQYIGEFKWTAGTVQLGVAGYGTPDFTLFTDGAERMRVTRYGLMGLGTPSPSQKMDIRTSSPDGLRVSTLDNQYIGGILWTPGAVQYIAAGYGTPDLSMQTGGLERLRITNDGNVGIGIAHPQSKLSVNGDITTSRLRVLQTGWSDFVFNQDYKLPTLKEVEAYIAANKHLPDVISAKEVEKNGLDVGDANKQLLQKIEELTLYLIEEHKKNAALEEKLAQMDTRLNNLECK